jgi:hypothetical protein
MRWSWLSFGIGVAVPVVAVGLFILVMNLLFPVGEE